MDINMMCVSARLGRWALLALGITILVACGRTNPSIEVDRRSAAIINGQVVPGGDDIKRGTIKLSDSALAGEQRICSGVVISKEAILTAAHCLYKHPVGQDDDDSYETRDFHRLFITFDSNGLEITKAVIDTQSFGLPSKGPGAHDLALLRFAGGLPPGVKAVPIMDDPHLQNGQDVTIAGFGKSLANQLDPSVVLRRGTMSIKNLAYSATEIELEVKANANQVSCEGDSGGPAFILNDNKLTLWGILRGGDFLCGYQSVYTRAYTHLDWIRPTLETWQQ